MKIAVAAETPLPDTSVSHHGARAPYYLLYDENGHFQEAVTNPHANAERGAGPRAAHFLAQQGVQVVAAGDFGERFIDELEASGIRPVEVTGMVSDIITGLLTT